MVVSYNRFTEVQWVGSHDSNIYVPHISSKDVLFYKKCFFGPNSINIGDFVLISNADAADPESIYECDIAKILNLYEICDESSTKDPCRAIVQWYSRPQKIPHKLFNDDDISINFDAEIIEEHRPFDRDISIETIFGKCIVMTASINKEASEMLKLKKKLKYPMFICRYKLMKYRNSYKLFPVEVYDENKEIGRNQIVSGKRLSTNLSEKKTPKRTNKKKLSDSSPTITKILPELEFININEIKNKVSPIKIITKNQVIKLPKVDPISVESENDDYLNTKEMNGNYLPESPNVQFAKKLDLNKSFRARLNLTATFENEVNITNDSDILNYSIINGTPEQTGETKPIKIKLRLSEKQKKSTRDVEPKVSSNIPGKFLERKRSIDQCNPDDVSYPTKRSPTQGNSSLRMRDVETPRRRSILKTPSSRHSVVGTPKRNIHLSNIVEKRFFEKNSIISSISNQVLSIDKRKEREISNENNTTLSTPTRYKSKTQSKKSSVTPKKRIWSDGITPNIDNRELKTAQRKFDLQLAREQLHVSAVPKSLPCRENEFSNIYSFIESKIQDQCGGCMYISGIPGTGKTATVTEVIRCLQAEAGIENIPDFEFIEINGMRLTEPRQAYVHIYKQLTGKSLSCEHAYSLLEKRFTTPAPRRKVTVLLVDELDILCNRRQDVVYNLLDWPTKSAAKLVVVTIANTMDLPERLLMGKVTSRLGLTRLTFQPYSFKQLQEIVTSRLSGFDAFKSDAVQLVARKVAAVSGDARRALDICRRATEIAEGSSSETACVTMNNVQSALTEMISSAKVQAIKNCSKLEQMFLQAVSAEVARTGVEETNFLGVYCQLETIAALMRISTPVPGRALKLCAKLGAERLLISEHSKSDIYQKILLNVSQDDIHYALQVKDD